MTASIPQDVKLLYVGCKSASVSKHKMAPLRLGADGLLCTAPPVHTCSGSKQHHGSVSSNAGQGSAGRFQGSTPRELSLCSMHGR